MKKLTMVPPISPEPPINTPILLGLVIAGKLADTFAGQRGSEWMMWSTAGEVPLDAAEANVSLVVLGPRQEVVAAARAVRSAGARSVPGRVASARVARPRSARGRAACAGRAGR